MALFTFIMEYEGGTYISQVNAESVEKARFEWIEKLEISEIFDFEESDKHYLIAEMEDEKPIKIETTKNVWCIYFLTDRDKPASINIIQTVEKTDNEQRTINN